tara:strand:+ start:1372 stop:1710 length:339 start_codon:yes stop_codon:yes gene_type:complete
MNAHLKGLKKKHEGLRDIAVADLQTYLDSQVAIGDHPHIGVAIEGKIEEIAKCDGVIEAIERYGRSLAVGGDSDSLFDDLPVPQFKVPASVPPFGDPASISPPPFRSTGPAW